MHTYSVIPATKERRRLCDEVGRQLGGKTEIVVCNNLALYVYPWRKEEHQPFVSKFLHDPVPAKDGDVPLGKYVAKTSREENTHTQTGQPQLHQLQRGTNWVPPNHRSLVVIVRIGEQEGAEKAKVLISRHTGDTRMEDLEVGITLVLHGPLQWRMKDDISVSYLHIPASKKVIGAETLASDDGRPYN